MMIWSYYKDFGVVCLNVDEPFVSGLDLNEISFLFGFLLCFFDAMVCFYM